MAILAVLGAILALTLTGGADDSPTTRPAHSGTPAVSSSATVGGTPEESTPALDEPEERLRGLLRPFAVSDCRAAPRTGDGVDATLSCVPGVSADASAPARLLISHYRDAAALTRDVARRSAAITDVGECARGESSTEQAVHNARRVGTFLCDAAPGRFAIFWTVDSQLVAFATDGADAGRLMAWWRGFEPF